VNTYGRVAVDYRTSAIDTLHDIESPQVNAAIDIAHLADDDLAKDSIRFVERLKYRLGEKGGLAATERVINVASRVDTNEARRKGLDALVQERDVRLRRILKQVDGNTEPLYKDYNNDVAFDDNFSEGVLFNGKRIETMTNKYLELREETPSSSPVQRTPAVELADALAGSDGVTLGATDRGGLSRHVEQHRKLFRIAQYLDESEEDFNFRVEEVTRRPVQVTHRVEQNFDIRNPEPIEETTQGVILVKPGKTGL
jgi:hypothetical protein